MSTYGLCPDRGRGLPARGAARQEIRLLRRHPRVRLPAVRLRLLHVAGQVPHRRLIPHVRCDHRIPFSPPSRQRGARLVVAERFVGQYVWCTIDGKYVLADRGPSPPPDSLVVAEGDIVPYNSCSPSRCSNTNSSKPHRIARRGFFVTQLQRLGAPSRCILVLCWLVDGRRRPKPVGQAALPHTAPSYS